VSMQCMEHSQNRTWAISGEIMIFTNFSFYNDKSTTRILR